MVHTVGPIGHKEVLLEDAYRNSLAVAVSNDVSSIGLKSKEYRVNLVIRAN